MTKNELALLGALQEIARISKEDCHWKDSSNTWWYNVEKMKKVVRKTLRTMPKLLEEKKQHEARAAQREEDKVTSETAKIMSLYRKYGTAWPAKELKKTRKYGVAQ
jgi:hypothetical protein